MKELKKLLNKYNYDLISTKPLEIISLEDENDTATGKFAQRIIDDLKLLEKENEKFNGTKIFEQDLTNKYGDVKGKIAILCGGLESENPIHFMNETIRDYVKDNKFNDFIDRRLDNPWCHVLIFGLDNIDLEDYETYKIKK